MTIYCIRSIVILEKQEQKMNAWLRNMCGD